MAGTMNDYGDCYERYSNQELGEVIAEKKGKDKNGLPKEKTSGRWEHCSCEAFEPTYCKCSRVWPSYEC